ncbi:MAG: Mur ligase family protein [Actinomycetota bacterium]|nr:Mur ligase family protein [Actinomycetota bacterium]
MNVANVNTATGLAFTVVAFAVSLIVSLKWLRVAQREHYVQGYVFRFAVRWYASRDMAINATLSFFVFIFIFISLSRPTLNSGVIDSFVGTAIFSLILPVGLGYRGRTSKLNWTRRLKALFGVVVAINILYALIAQVLGLAAPMGVAEMGLSFLFVEVAIYIMQPIEDKKFAPYILSAKKKLEEVAPTIVGITGSYGKTSTKNYLATLTEGSLRVFATPASFNNRGGLTRAINENLLPGTDLFIAEMGTYGKGEIASLCSWCPPKISALTALGPVHLERFGTEEKILEAKLEITASAETVVVQVDDLRLLKAAGELEANGKKVVRVSGKDLTKDVAVLDDSEGNHVVYVKGRRIGSTDVQVANSNLAVAVAIALEVGVAEEEIGDRLSLIAPTKNRCVIETNDRGVTVVDDTYNSNPTGARFALGLGLSKRLIGGRLIFVTPGMIELGDKQYEENRALGGEVAQIADFIVIIGKTNLRALRAGALNTIRSTIVPKAGPGDTLTVTSKCKIIEVKSREKAVEWVRENSQSGDVVVYENDLPDHFA